MNAEVGANYEKGDLVVMIGENYSKSNRENAVTALTETLRQSPIGSALKQGLPIEISFSSGVVEGRHCNSSNNYTRGQCFLQ